MADTASDTETDPDTEVDDVTDPAFWARPEFAVRPPDIPVLYSKLSCLSCEVGTAYGDGTGGYKCMRCGWSS